MKKVEEGLTREGRIISAKEMPTIKKRGIITDPQIKITIEVDSRTLTFTTSRAKLKNNLTQLISVSSITKRQIPAKEIVINPKTILIKWEKNGQETCELSKLLEYLKNGAVKVAKRGNRYYLSGYELT